MNNDICGNCEFFNEYKKFVNDNYECKYHNLTVKPEQMGCYINNLYII